MSCISTWWFTCPEAWSMLQRCHLWCDPGADAEFCRLHAKILWPTGPFIDLTYFFVEVSGYLSTGFGMFWSSESRPKHSNTARVLIPGTRSSPWSCAASSPRMPFCKVLTSKFALGPTSCATCCNRSWMHRCWSTWVPELFFRGSILKWSEMV